jgi:hypothetical protein
MMDWGDRFVAKNEHTQLIASSLHWQSLKNSQNVRIRTNLFTKANRFGSKHPPCEKDGCKNACANHHDESGRMFPGVKKMGTKNSCVNCNDESGRMFPGVKEMGAKPFFPHHNLFCCFA